MLMKVITTAKMRIIRFIYLQTCLSAVMGVYIKEYMVTIQPQIPLNNNSHFGYSIAYFNKQLFISAPAADNIGHIYTYNRIKDMVKKIVISIPRLRNYNTDYWMGATIKSGPTFVVICAPRAVFKPYIVPVTVGTCFKLSRQEDKAIVKRLPDLADTDKISNGGMNSYGWSIEVDPHDRILVGGPAIVKDKNSGVEIFYNDDINPTLVNTKNIFNLGYSIVSGNFLTNTEVTYAVSTTYGGHGEGQILLYDEKVRYIKMLDHGEVGSMYGAVLCAARLGHTRTSLLVGAPTFASDGRYNTGAVYLYLPVNKTEILLDRIIKGTVDGGHFGSAIANLGDLDGDSKEDFAIGAPYEGLGAVYIYTGYGLLSGQSWWRKIQPEKFHSFGFSLVSLPYTSERPCNDLAVGAPLSNHVSIMKCIPVTTIEIYTKFPDLQNRLNQTFFQFLICFKFVCPTNLTLISSKLKINVQMTHSTATLENKSCDVSRTMEGCQACNVLTPIKGNYDELLKFNFTAVVDTSNGKVPDMVLSDRSVISLQKSIWAANCKLMYGHCFPQLKAEPSTSFSTPYKVGLQKSEQFSLLIENSGETAYDACAVIWQPKALMKQIPPGCTRDGTTQQVVCKPSEPLLSGSKWQTGNIEIDTTSLTNNDESIDIHYDIYNHCGNETERHSSKLSYPLVFSFDGIVISGISSPSRVMHVSEEDASLRKHFQHIYTITNNGAIDLVDVKFKMLAVYSRYLVYTKPTVKGTTLQECVFSGEGHVTCNIREFPKSAKIIVVLPLSLQPNTFSNIENVNNTFYTEVRFEILSNTNKILYSTTKSTSTYLEPLTTSVPIWIWIVAFLIALFILIITVLVLRKYGFLKRKNKTNLEQLKKSMRRSGRQGSQNVSLCPSEKEVKK